MRLRNFIAVLLTVLLIPLFPLTAHSSQKVLPGNSCKMHKQKVVNQNKTYTCIKSGKRLIWSKGVPLRKLQELPSPKPSPTASFVLSGKETLRSEEACKLLDSSGNLFRLGFPIEPIIENLTRVNILAIPFEFKDSASYRLSSKQTSDMFADITDYFYRESYGKTKIEVSLPPKSNGSQDRPALVIGMNADQSPLTKRFTFLDFNSIVTELLGMTPSDWNLGGYDSIVLYSQDTRTFNFLGGQGWRGKEGSKLSQNPFITPSGKVRSLVFGSGITTVMIHELGHSLLGLIDLYDQSGGQTYAQGWGLMASAYSGEINLRGWEKFIAGWITPSEVLCVKSSSTHFIEFIHSASKEKSLLIYPVAEDKAIVVEAIDLSFVANEVNGRPIFCDQSSMCKNPKEQGLLAYLVDLTKPSAMGPISVPERIKYPNVLKPSDSVELFGVQVTNLGCLAKGCAVSVKS